MIVPYATNNYPIFGSSVDQQGPQIAQYAFQNNAAIQANNQGLERRDAIEAQNRMYEFQARKDQEQQDMERQRYAESQTYQRQNAADLQALAKYKFDTEQKGGADYLAKQDEWRKQDQATKLLMDNFAVTDNAKAQEQKAVAWLHDKLGKGEHIATTDQQLSEMTGLPVPAVQAIANPYRTAYPDAQVSLLNRKLDELLLKDNKNELTTEKISRMTSDLPPSIQPNVYYSPTEKKFIRTDNRGPLTPAEVNNQGRYSNPGSGPTPVYNFQNGTVTATTPPNLITVQSPRPPLPHEISAVTPQLQTPWAYGNAGPVSLPPVAPGKPKLTVEMARLYKNKYRDRKAAEEAAIADGWSL